MKYQTGGPKRFAHQRRGLAKLIDTHGVTALLFDPGLGKTATVLDYLGLLAIKARPASDGVREVRCLVVCPLAAVDTWVLQAQTFMSPMVNYWVEAMGGSLLQRAETLAARGGQPFKRPLVAPPKRRLNHHPRALHHDKAIAWDARTQPGERETAISSSEGPDGLGLDTPRVVIEVVNVDTLQYRTRVGSRSMADVMLDAVKRFAPEIVVVDEAHRIKSPTGHASRLLARLSPFVPRRVILTGTVMPHSPIDVFAQWRFMEPYAFGEKDAAGNLRQATLGGFTGRYAVQGGWQGREVIGFRNLDEMQAIMRRNAVVARKADALDLPKTMDVVVPVELSATEKRAYSEMKSALAVQLSNGQLATTGNRLTQLLRLRQITTGYLMDDNGVTVALGDSKIRTIKSLVEDKLAGEKRIVIFALFVWEIHALAKALAVAGTEVMVIGGGTKGQDRMAMRRRFGSDDPARMVMIAQVRTMSLAVNELVTANHAIFGSLSQLRDDFEQAKARLDRQGQTKPVTFWLTAAPGTVDEVILRTHQQRGDLETAVLAHIRGEA
jgi:SNF2 family DNA or RNA helicase